MVNKLYKISSQKENKNGSKHNQVLMSIIGKFLYKTNFISIFNNLF